MSHPDPYESWKQRRAALGPPADFADRVMAALGARQGERLRRALGLRLLLSRFGRVALCSLACAAFLFRILQLVAPFLLPQSTL
jgi:hypothetical protein